MANFPGPYELRIFYTVTTSPGDAIQHQLRINVDCDPAPDPGDTFNTIQVKLAGGSTTGLHNTTLAIVNLVEDFYNGTDATFDYAELWLYEAASFEAAYISTYAIGLPGTSAEDTFPASQTIWTFRTVGGGILKVSLMDNVSAPYVPVAYADLNAVNKALVDYVVDDTLSPFLGRDNTRPLAFLRQFAGQNEHLFKTRYGR